jgi:hypothetical protein
MGGCHRRKYAALKMWRHPVGGEACKMTICIYFKKKRRGDRRVRGEKGAKCIREKQRVV